jgi:hypothetical protein
MKEPEELHYFLHCQDAIADLRTRGLTIAHAVEDFLSRRLNLVKERVDPSWDHAFGVGPDVGIQR